jgi:hypothetical protein
VTKEVDTFLDYLSALDRSRAVELTDFIENPTCLRPTWFDYGSDLLVDSLTSLMTGTKMNYEEARAALVSAIKHRFLTVEPEPARFLAEVEWS